MKYFDLKDYYETNFNLINTKCWSLNDLDNMYFWEREIYINLLQDYNEKLKQKHS
jgi:hypothetical protein